MPKTIHAIYENGVFRPTEKVDLPEHCSIEVEVRQIVKESAKLSLDDIYEILLKRFDTGEPDVAARHDEHQP